RVGGVGGPPAPRRAAPRGGGAPVGLDAGLAGERRAVVAHRERQEMELDVRVAHASAAADEAAGLEVVARAEAVLGEDPAHANEGPAQERHLRVERDRLAASDLEIELEVILQVLAHSGQVGDYVDAESRELTGRPDARELEQLRGVDGTRAEEHLALGEHRAPR